MGRWMNNMDTILDLCSSRRREAKEGSGGV
jgi:hypothetical protein